MKYILEASDFYKFIKKGTNNKVFNLDKYWVIKMPLRPDEIEGGTVNNMPSLNFWRSNSLPGLDLQSLSLLVL